MSSANPRDRYSGWLPPLTDGKDVCWFPLHQRAFPAVVASLSRPSDDGYPPVLLDALRHDPLLLTYAAVGWLREESCGHTAPSTAGRTELADSGTVASVTLAKLSQWWTATGRQMLAACDSLSIPSDETVDWNRLAQLDGYFATLPLRRRFASSSLWLEALRCDVPPAVLEQLEGLELVAETPADREGWPPDRLAENASGANVRVLVSLAKQAGRAEQLERQFTRQVDRTRRDLAKQIAYGLSHEINNPLANIATRAQGLQDLVRRPANVSAQDDVANRLHDGLQRIVDQVYRAHAMIADLMFYANPPELAPQRFDLIERIGKVLDAAAPEAERLQIALSGPLGGGGAEGPLGDAGWGGTHSEAGQGCQVDGDPDMVGDAVAACVRNAMDAVGRNGRIVIEVARLGGELVIRISDSGPGVSAEASRRAFDPYFSGREAGRGLGLGLCRAERIVQLHGGSIRLHPALAGCVAEIRLPGQPTPDAPMTH